MAASDLSTLAIDRSSVARAPRRRRHWVWAVTVCIIAAAAAASARYGGSVSVETAPVTTAYPSQAMTSLNATGYVVAQRKAAVASKATGRLEWLGAAEGSKVRRGEVIARLENRDVSVAREQVAASLKVARANLEQGTAELVDAERNLHRSQDLVGRKFISEAAHDTAVARHSKAQAAIRSLQASIEVADANLKAADVAIDQTAIRAPFDGVVLTKHADVGDNITPFSNAVDTKGAVFTIADMSTLEVEADVAESSLSQTRIGQPVEIQLDAVPGHRFPGVVDRIVPTVDRAKATVLIKIKFTERDLRTLPDMSAKVAFLGRAPSEDERKPVTVAPAAAVIEHDGAQVVYVVEDGRAREAKVETGRAIGELLEVRGVEAGMTVVVKPGERVSDGVAVRVAQK